MRIITHNCPDCGTVVAGNVLESRREMRCPRVGCESVLRFADLPDDERNHILNNLDTYHLES